MSRGQRIEAAEADRDEALRLLRGLMLPGAWQEMTDGETPKGTGFWVTLLSTPHREKIDAFLAQHPAAGGE